MEQILEILKGQPKEVLQWLILELMKEGRLSFTDIAETHIKYLEMLKKGESEKLINLRSEVIRLWCGTKKDLPKSLVALITEGCDNRWALTYDHYKNKNHSYYGLFSGADNLVDACYEMIIKLYEQNLL